MGKKRYGHKRNEDEEPYEEKDLNDINPLEAFFLQEKLDAFINSYEPLNKLEFGCETFSDSQLREFFKAYVLPSYGDPLKMYLEKLSALGFSFQVSLATREPVMYVRQKFINN